MEDFSDNRSCKAKVGLLFLRDCGGVVQTNCVLCKRPICRNHCVESEQGIVCPECGASLKHTADDPRVDKATRRNRYYRDYGYSPFYYGSYHYYSDMDYQTFEHDDQTGQDGEGPRDGLSEDLETGGFEPDDFMES